MHFPRLEQSTLTANISGTVQAAIGYAWEQGRMMKNAHTFIQKKEPPGQARHQEIHLLKHGHVKPGFLCENYLKLISCAVPTAQAYHNSKYCK